MKRKIKELVRNLGYLLSFVFPYKFYNGYRLTKTLIYSGYVKRQFKKVGPNLHIESPLYMVGGQYISIGADFTALAGFWIDAYNKHETYGDYKPEIIIGDKVSFNFGCHIGCINRVTIGNGVLAASKVYITDHFHGDTEKNLAGRPVLRPLISKGPVLVEDNVWIGENVVIMPNVTIGKGSIIGANSVVTKSFPAYSVLAGAPARLIKSVDYHE